MSASTCVPPGGSLRAWVVAEAVRSDDTVRDVLLREDLTPQERAEVAEQLCPGAGKDYLK